MLTSLFPFSAFAETGFDDSEAVTEIVSIEGENSGEETPEVSLGDESYTEGTGNADGEGGESISTYTVSLTLPEKGVALADGSGELTQNVSAGSVVADIRLVSTYEDEPLESDMADIFNERLFNGTGLTASCDENGVITVSGTPTADVTVNLADAFAEEAPATVDDTAKTEVYVATATATATESYTSPLGNDSTGNGSQDSPYATIGKAYTEVASGGTIYLLSDVDVSAQITFGTNKTITITSADSSNVKTIYSKCASLSQTESMMLVNKGEVILTNITLDGEGQKNSNGKYDCPGCIHASASGATATVTLDTGTTIQNFKKDNGTSGGCAVVNSKTNGSSRINIKDGVLIKECELTSGTANDPAAVLCSGAGATMYMTGGTVTGNTLSTSQTSTTAIVNIGMYKNPHFWMTGGTITGNTINNGCAAVYMRGAATACDIEFGDTAYVYGNYVSGTSGDQKNIYLKNNNNGTENSNIYVKLCSALTKGAKLGVYAEKIGIGTKVAQGGGVSGVGTGSYTATAKDSTYFVSDKETGADIVYCGGSADTCGLLAHRDNDTNHNNSTSAIYLSVSPTVTATKNTPDGNPIDISIARCTSDATYVVLDKDLKPVKGKTLTGGAYVEGGNGTFKLSDSGASTNDTIGMQGLSKDNGPYTVMLVGEGDLSVDSTTGKADTDSLTDIATVNIVNFAGENVTWSDGTNTFTNGDFDIVTVPHNDQTGKANKTYTATTKTGYAFAVGEAITGKLNNSDSTAVFTATKDTSAEKYHVSVTVPAYDTTKKGTENYNTVTLTGNTILNTGVKLLDKTNGTEMTDGKTYDGNAVVHTGATVDGATLTYTWQKKNTDGSTTEYTNLTAAPSDAGEYNLEIKAKKTDETEIGTQNIPFTISKKELTVNVTAQNKEYDGTTTATLNTATLNDVVDADAGEVTLVTSGVSATFDNKDVGMDKAVTLTGSYTLTGEKAKNYTVTQPTGLKANITAAPLTITGATVTAKTYDGTDNAAITNVTFDGLKNGETLTFNADYTVSNAKYDKVNATGENAATKVTFEVTLGSTDTAKNYILSNTAETQTATTATGTQDATIGKANYGDKALATNGKRGATNTLDGLSTYVVTGGTVGTVTTAGDGIFEETPTYDSSTGELTYKLNGSATESQTATVTLPVTSANYNDYNIVVTVGVTSKETVTINITKGNFVYNGSAQAPSDIAVDEHKVQKSGLVVTYEGTDGTTYPESTTAPTNAGKYIMTVKVPEDSTEYTGSATCNFEITKKALTATITAEDKTYDGNKTANVTKTLDGVVEGDSGKVTASVTNPAFENKNVGTNKKVTANISLTGDAAGNYTVNATAETTASITAKEVTIDGVTVEASKTYDKITNAEITNNGKIKDKVETDNLEIKAGTASYDNAKVGTDKTVTFTGFALTGTDASNYTLTGQPTSTTAAITAKEVTISGVTIEPTKVYDGNTGASITNSGALNDVITGDTVTIKAGTATYNDENAGENKTVTFSSFELEGADASNYRLTGQPESTTAAITQREITISGLSATKTYDGNETADKSEITGTAVIENKAAGSDNVSLNTDNMTGTFNSANVNEATTVTITGLSLTGDDAKNYKLPDPVTCKGTITTANGSGSVTLTGWTYGETANIPQPTSTTNGTDHVAYQYRAKNAAESDPWQDTVPTNAGEYTVKATFKATNNYDTVVTTADFTIEKKALIVTISAENKPYDGTDAAKVRFVSATGIVTSDNDKVAVNVTNGQFNSKDAGVQFVTAQLTLSGTAKSNYTVSPRAEISAEITPKPLTLAITAKDKQLDGSSSAELDIAGAELRGVLDGEQVSVASAVGTFTNPNTAGDSAEVTVSNVELTGADSGNYSVGTIDPVTAKLLPLEVKYKSGESTLKTETISVYEKVAEEYIPEKKGYNFAGWFTDEACKNAWNRSAGVTKDITVYAKWTKETLYTLSGNVTESDGTTAASGATVKLCSGNEVIAETKTDENGSYSFGNVPSGVYNLTAKKDGKGATESVKVEDANTTKNIKLPSNAVAAEVEVDKKAPAATVGGMAKVLEALVGADDSDKKITVGENERLEVKLNVKDDASPNEKSDIQEKAPNKSNWDFINMDVDWTKYKTESGTESQTDKGDIKNTIEVLAIRVPYDMSGRRDIVIYRHHVDATSSTAEVTALTPYATEPAEGSYEDGHCYIGENYIVIYSRQFSAFGIGYTATGSSSGGYVAPAPTISGAANGGTYCESVTLTIQGDNISSVTVDGEKATLTDGKLTLTPSENPQTVVAKNISGNSAAITVTVKDGHSYGEWTTAEDGTTSHVCSVCGTVESRDAAEDKTEPSKDQDKNTDKDKANGNSGNTDKNGNKADNAENSGNTNIPKTGDENSLMLWLLLTLLTGAGLFTIKKKI